jgi:hypothetical protein
LIATCVGSLTTVAALGAACGSRSSTGNEGQPDGGQRGGSDGGVASDASIADACSTTDGSDDASRTCPWPSGFPATTTFDKMNPLANLQPASSRTLLNFGGGYLAVRRPFLSRQRRSVRASCHERGAQRRASAYPCGRAACGRSSRFRAVRRRASGGPSRLRPSVRRCASFFGCGR